LKLRNIGGVIVVDFIDMESRRDQFQLLEHFTSAIKDDSARPQIAQLTELGLVELTRKRQGQNIYELFGKKCSTCNGTGHVENQLNYEISNTPPDNNLRKKKFSLSLNQLILDFKRQYPKKYDSLYHITKRRIIRSMEILNQNENLDMNLNQLNTTKTLVLGIKINRTKNLSLIRKRLFYRLENGMIEEVEQLINNGLDIERLNYFGLEYKFIGKYINNEFSF